MNNTKGIYAIRNKITGCAYIGQSVVSIENRWSSHIAVLKKGKHTNKFLQDDWDKYGIDNYEFIILEEVDDKSKIDEREIYWIVKYKEDGKAFNQQSGGKGFAGMHISDNAKKIIGEKNRQHMLGHKDSEETKLKKRNSHLGIKHSPEWIEKCRLKQIGKEISAEQRLKLSIANSGENSGFAKYTKEQVLKAREIFDGGNHDYNYIAEQTGISKKSLYGIINKTRWKYI